MLTGLSTVNIELTSRCNKSCHCCGRRKLEKIHKTDWGDMRLGLIEKIAEQVAPGIVVQLHNNGEPLLHEKLGFAISLFDKQVTSFNTNGILLIERADAIIGNLDTLVVSVIENDLTQQDQYETVLKFMHRKGDAKPLMVFRLLGKIDRALVERYKMLGIVVTRVLHDPMGSRNYEKQVTKPEIGVCLDLLHHLAIDRYGKVSCCVRFDPDRLGVIGDVNKQSLDEIWNGPHRAEIIRRHLRGERDLVPLCSTCEFWGTPTGV